MAEGLSNCTSHGQPISFKGAHIACVKNCVIVEGFSRVTLPNGQCRVIHNMRTSGGCPVYSTLNDIDGVANESGETIAEKHFLNANGEWVPVQESKPHEDIYDEQPKLIAPPIDGVPYYVETLDGRTFSGRTGADGLLARVDTYGEDEYAIYWGDEAIVRMEGVEV